jgi:hypothetical protein
VANPKVKKIDAIKEVKIEEVDIHSPIDIEKFNNPDK